jgi:hypothetical protein
MQPLTADWRRFRTILVFVDDPSFSCTSLLLQYVLGGLKKETLRNGTGIEAITGVKKGQKHASAYSASFKQTALPELLFKFPFNSVQCTHASSCIL